MHRLSGQVLRKGSNVADLDVPAVLDS